VCSLLSLDYSQFYGLSEEEVVDVLGFEGMGDRFTEVKAFYNGYVMAGSDKCLFIPWTIINYLVRKTIAPYWVMAGGTDPFIAEALWSCGEDSRVSFLALLKGKHAVVPYTDDVNYERLSEAESLWSVLFHCGNVTGAFEVNSNRKLTVRAPNTEVKEELARLWKRYFLRERMGPAYEAALCGLFNGNGLLFMDELMALARYTEKFPFSNF